MNARSNKVANLPRGFCTPCLSAQKIGPTVTAIVLLSIVVTGCTTPLTRDSRPDVYRGYAGSELSDASLAKIDLGLAHWAEVSGPGIEHTILIGFRNEERTGYGSVALAPGKYTVKWGRLFGVGFTVDPSMEAAYEDSTEVRLNGGDRYLLHMDRNYGAGYVVFSWIEDESTGFAIYGVEKP